MRMFKKNKKRRPQQRQGLESMGRTQRALYYTIWVVIAAVVVSALVGCKSKKQIVDTDKFVRDTCYIHTRSVDTIIQHEPDTALARLKVECDENNNVLVSLIDQLQGERTTIGQQVKYITVRDTAGMVRREALISAEAIAQGFADQVSIQESFVSRVKTENEQLHKELEKKSTAWLFWLCLGIMGTLVGVCIIKLINK